MGNGFTSCSTSGVAPHRRVDYWNEQVSGAITSLQVQPVRESELEADLTAAEFAGIQFAAVRSTPTRVVHTPQRQAQESCYLLQLQRAGHCVNRTQGSEAQIGPGDFVLCDNSVPYELNFSDHNSTLVLRMPQWLLKRHLATPEAFVNRPMSGDAGASALTSHFIGMFWDQCRSGIGASAADKLAESICDVVAAAFIDSDHKVLDCSTVQTNWRLRICRYIDRHLGDPDLGPVGIAAHFRVSPRYIHKLFEHQDEAICRYIQRRRLESACRALLDSTQRVKSVSTIAYEWGFSNTTHFARVFRERYGAAPTELRRRRTALAG
ncbi:MAG: helix-turn-helix domain-containing protein [Steroidobacteraceae bacterium]